MDARGAHIRVVGAESDERLHRCKDTGASVVVEGAPADGRSTLEMS